MRYGFILCIIILSVCFDVSLMVDVIGVFVVGIFICWFVCVNVVVV